ncbi:MAG: hypothetical protein M0R51_09020 [Clostridia bacterium]|jgi:L-lactate utilization protein LutC|nr:hypothetical protein [Clostridia bacterium]
MENKDKKIELAEEVKEKIKKALEEANKPQVVKSIGMRDKETDIRQLSAKDYRQLQYREIRDTNGYLKFLNMSANDIAIIVSLIAEKLGINVDEEVENKRQQLISLQNSLKKDSKEPKDN